MKGILFNQDMVRAILNGTKTVTRRVVRPQLKTKCSYGGQHEFIQDDFIEWVNFRGFVCRKCGYGVCGPHFKFPVGTSWIRPPYRPGNILYVRETFKIDYLSNVPGSGRIHYKADDAYIDFTFEPERYEMMRRAQLKPGWRPSENMPREAARVFLRVTDVRVERLQEITHSGIAKEGIATNGTPGSPDRINPFFAFKSLWDSTIKTADRAIYRWDANPWVWVIEFKRCEKPGGD